MLFFILLISTNVFGAESSDPLMSELKKELIKSINNVEHELMLKGLDRSFEVEKFCKKVKKAQGLIQIFEGILPENTYIDITKKEDGEMTYHFSSNSKVNAMKVNNSVWFSGTLKEFSKTYAVLHASTCDEQLKEELLNQDCATTEDCTAAINDISNMTEEDKFFSINMEGKLEAMSSLDK